MSASGLAFYLAIPMIRVASDFTAVAATPVTLTKLGIVALEGAW